MTQNTRKEKGTRPHEVSTRQKAPSIGRCGGYHDCGSYCRNSRSRSAPSSMKSPSTPVASKAAGCWMNASTRRAKTQVVSQSADVVLAALRERKASQLTRPTHVMFGVPWASFLRWYRQKKAGYICCEYFLLLCVGHSEHGFRVSNTRRQLQNEQYLCIHPLRFLGPRCQLDLRRKLLHFKLQAVGGEDSALPIINPKVGIDKWPARAGGRTHRSNFAAKIMFVYVMHKMVVAKALPASVCIQRRRS